MPRQVFSQNGFNAGRLSPLLEGRQDIAQYDRGLSEARNCLVTTRGPVNRRSATQFIAEAKNSTSNIALIPFQFSEDDSFMLEFCDRYIRETFSELDPEECYKACEAITELGRELSCLNAEIELTKPIPILGIPAGTHKVQRLLYYNFIKCFWNDAFDFETNNMVNFDWYHPRNAWQHTQQEVEGWLKELGVNAYSFNDSNPNGISVLLRKPLA